MAANEMLADLARVMGARKVTVLMIRAGLSPVQISKLRQVNLTTTLGYVDEAIGAGSIRRSDVLFTVPLSLRRFLAGEEELPKGVDPQVYKKDHKDHTAVIKKYGSAVQALGDMYEDLRALEVSLHDLAKDTLIKALGAGESGWWSNGIPLALRRKCQRRRQEDQDPAPDEYAYTDLLDLGEVIKANWSLFRTALPSKYQDGLEQLRADLRRLNDIRRRVMHPVRRARLEEDDFRFTRDMRRVLLPEEGTRPEIDQVLSKLKAALVHEGGDE